MNITKKDLGKEKTRLKRDQIDVFFDLVKRHKPGNFSSKVAQNGTKT